jgi:transcriptional regulator with XRE-family HTH domain
MEALMVYGRARASHEPTLYTGIGEQIMLARRRAGLNQTEAGSRLGITAAAVSDLERGKTRPNLDNLEEIANALGVLLTQIVVLERRPAQGEAPE